jgi:hypothetical protein
MRIESDLIVVVTLALSRRGVVALPTHDAVAVPISPAPVTNGQIEARFLTGADIPVDIQRIAN